MKTQGLGSTMMLIGQRSSVIGLRRALKDKRYRHENETGLCVVDA
jgi:hypothetical protein